MFATAPPGQGRKTGNLIVPMGDYDLIIRPQADLTSRIRQALIGLRQPRRICRMAGDDLGQTMTVFLDNMVSFSREDLRKIALTCACSQAAVDDKDASILYLYF